MGGGLICLITRVILSGKLYIYVPVFLLLLGFKIFALYMDGENFAYFSTLKERKTFRVKHSENAHAVKYSL